MKEEQRKSLLSKVFVQFDLDNSGWVERWELLLLGKSRRKVSTASFGSCLGRECEEVQLQLGQKEGLWTATMNKNCVDKMDADDDGRISKAEFCKHFSEVFKRRKRSHQLTFLPQALPEKDSEFTETVEDFLMVAEDVRANKSGPALSSGEADLYVFVRTSSATIIDSTTGVVEKLVHMNFRCDKAGPDDTRVGK